MKRRLSNLLNYITAMPAEVHELLEHANQGTSR